MIPPLSIASQFLLQDVLKVQTDRLKENSHTGGIALAQPIKYQYRVHRSWKTLAEWIE
jgi:hypothetical protein